MSRKKVKYKRIILSRYNWKNVNKRGAKRG